MTFNQFIGKLLNIENLESIEKIETSFGASWAQSEPFWVFLGCLLFSVLSFVFYFKFQNKKRPKLTFLLSIFRGISLCLLLLILAEPVLLLTSIHRPRPLLWLMFDGTDSMGIKDELPNEERDTLDRSLGRLGAQETLARQEYVQALLKRENGEFLRKLGEKYRLRSFLLDRPDGVRALELPANVEDYLDKDFHESEAIQDFYSKLTTQGEVTALGSGIKDLSRRQGIDKLAGLVLFSDFDQNTGPSGAESAESLGVPVYTVGIGPESAIDLEVALQAPLLMKKSERSTLSVNLKQQGLDGSQVEVELVKKKLSQGSESAGVEEVVETKTVDIQSQSQSVEFNFTPDTTGRFSFEARVPKQEGEVLDQNNTAEREVSIRDDFLRLLFVEYEPTWEWRFIKEVFHRDKLVGTRGFRTFLRSADPRVRETNELFLPTLNIRRSKFFENDVIFIGDMPSSALSDRFCEMVKEWVSQFGGGLVILSGPRYGPQQLRNTPLADMLPVVLESHGRYRDDREFSLELNPEASQYDFMQLGSNPRENQKAWQNLGKLSWYQPVMKVHPLATVLAQHPEHTCADGETPQPLISIRRYGKGEVVYLGFNETWRLRKRYGELYYRQFWGQMIHRLGLSHSLGVQKRFVVRTDRTSYRSDDPVVITVEAFDRDYTPLQLDKHSLTSLEGTLYLPEGGDQAEQPILLSPLRDGVFEMKTTPFLEGEYRVQVKDPITGEIVESIFQVASQSLERRRATRNLDLEREIAQKTGGESYSLAEAPRLPDELKLPDTQETKIAIVPLWNTWLFFIIVVLALLTEWLIRKLIHLP